MQQAFVIKIAELQYALNNREAFQLVKGQQDKISTEIPLAKFRVRDGSWHILWDKRTQSFYNPGLNIAPFPLTVEWTRAEIITDNREEQDRVALLILLSEIAGYLSQQNGCLKKADLQLEKTLIHFINRHLY